MRHGARVQVWDSREDPPHAAALGDAAQRLTGPLDAALAADVKLVLKSPGLAPHDAAHRAAAAGRARARPGGAERAGPVHPRAGRAESRRRRALRAAGAGHHRHQRQDHGDGDDLVARGPHRPARGHRRQHRPDAAGHADRAAGRSGRRTRPGLGAGAVQLPARRCGRLRTRRRRRAEPDAGPPGLARQHGRLRRRQGAHLRHAGADGDQRRRPVVAAMVPVPVIPKGRKTPVEAPRAVCRFSLQAPQHAGRLRPRGRKRHGLAGACLAGRRDDQAQEGRSRRDPPAAPDAGRRAACARPPQRRQRAGRAGPGHRHRLPAGADAARPARVHRRAAPRGARRQRRWHRGLRRQQGHQRRRHRGRARRPGGRSGAGPHRRHPGWRRQGAGLQPAGRAGAALRARRGADRP